MNDRNGWNERAICRSLGKNCGSFSSPQESDLHGVICNNCMKGFCPRLVYSPCCIRNVVILLYQFPLKQCVSKIITNSKIFSRTELITTDILVWTSQLTELLLDHRFNRFKKIESSVFFYLNTLYIWNMLMQSTKLVCYNSFAFFNYLVILYMFISYNNYFHYFFILTGPILTNFVWFCMLRRSPYLLKQ